MKRILALPAALLAAAPALAAEIPRIHLESLERVHPGWTMTERTGDEKSGTLAAERLVWSLFYLDWIPLKEGVDSISARDAEKRVAGLWEGLSPDTPVKAAPVDLPAHPGFVVETTTFHGEMKNRYYVWACPQSHRLFVVDGVLSTAVNASATLFDWLRDMARTVRCHDGAAVEEFQHLPRRYDVPGGGGVSYAMPQLWAPVPGYRVQRSFLGSDFAATHPAVTPAEGQDLAVPSDALLRLYVTWRPYSDEIPMTYEILKQETEDFWQQHAANMMIEEMRAVRDTWIIDGRIRPGRFAVPVPPTRDHKFRGWLWRKDGRLYYAAATIGSVYIGRRFPGQTLAVWDKVLEGIYQSVEY